MRVDGLATRVQRPAGWANQKVLYDAKRHAPTAQAWPCRPSMATRRDGTGLAGSCHEQELLALSGLDRVLDVTQVASLLNPGSRAWPRGRDHWHAPIGDRRTKDPLTHAQRAFNRVQAGCAPWWSSRSASGDAWALRRWRGLLYRVRDVFPATAALVCLGRWLQPLAPPDTGMNEHHGHPESLCGR